VKLTSYHEVDIYTQEKYSWKTIFQRMNIRKSMYENAAYFHTIAKEGEMRGNWDGSNGKGRMSLEKWNRRTLFLFLGDVSVGYRKGEKGRRYCGGERDGERGKGW
jgi:hypothetical protein